MAVQHSFELTVGGERIPGLAWLPDRVSGPLPTVLMGHGRGGDKSRFGLERPGERFADGHGWAAVSIDAQFHGERRELTADPDSRPPVAEAIKAGREWQAVIELLTGQQIADPLALAYWGFSMGAAVGIALMATEPRIRCAVIGLMRSSYYPQISAHAADIRCPVRFSIHSDDRLMPRERCLELFDAIASPDKRLDEYPGRHDHFSALEIDGGEAFLTEQLPTAPA